MNTTTARRPRLRRPILAAAFEAGLVAGLVPFVTTPSPVEAAPPSACGPLGKLAAYVLNDRCDYGTNTDPDTVVAATVVARLGDAGLFATTVECDGSVVPIIASPDQLLVTAANHGQLDEAVAKVQTLLGPAFEATAKLNALAARVTLRPGALDDAFLVGRIPQLQGDSWSTDLNYLEPALPNNGFRPADNPLPATAATGGVGGKGRVLVLDSPAERRRYPVAPDVVLSSAGPLAVYDVDGNKKIDEDHGHGVFVASLIKRLAPSADVTLFGVNGGHVPGSGRWSPMMFSDADLIVSMGMAFGLSGSGTSTRASFDVVNLSLGGAGCGGVATRLGLGRFMRDLANSAAATGRRPVYVAAAGNDGGAVDHFPAAFRDEKAMGAAADAIDKAAGSAPSAAGEAVREIGADLSAGMWAVGSWTAGTRDAFSNCGDWVNAIAAGSGAVSRYPSGTSWASWSGTSFATPQVAASILGAAVKGVTLKDRVGSC